MALALLFFNIDKFCSVIPTSCASVFRRIFLFAITTSKLISIFILTRLLYWIIADVLYGALLSVILSSNGNQQNRELNLTLTAPDLLPLILAAIIIVISQIMTEGQKISDEHQQTI
jgi:hypothetical protein